MKPIFSMPGKSVELVSNQTYQLDPVIDHGQRTVITADGYASSWTMRPTEHNIITVAFDALAYDPDYLALLDFFRTWTVWKKNQFTYTDPSGVDHTVIFYDDSFGYERFATNYGRCSFRLLEVI